MYLQMPFSQSLTFHTKPNSSLHAWVKPLYSPQVVHPRFHNSFFTSVLSQEFPVQPTFCYSCSTSAYQNGPFLCSEEAVGEDQEGFLCPFTLQASSYGIPTTSSLEKTVFGSPEVGDCNSTCPPHFSDDLKFNHLAVADIAVAEAVSDYSSPAEVFS